MQTTVTSWKDGLWHNNPGLVQLLGLCPLLAVTTHVAYGLGLGIATTAVMVLSSAAVSIMRRWINAEIRIAVFVLIIATAVTLAERLFMAWAFSLYSALGIFLPLIVTNCAILARAEAFASRQPLGPSVADGLFMGAGFTLALVTMGAVRELIAQGTLLDRMELLFGPGAAALEITLLESDGMLLAALPPGAFMALGLLVAAHRALQARIKTPSTSQPS
ncbi:MAG: electron transport complex subunit E [Lysobacterales bacterium]